MNTLTIYSQKYDLNENIVNGGMSGKAFLDMDNGDGMPFDSIDDALEYVSENNTRVQGIEMNYVGRNGIQMFNKFFVIQK